MNKVVPVALREFIATVKTKAFVLSVVLMPVIMVGAIYGTEAVHQMAIREKIDIRRVAAIDYSGVVFPYLAAQVAQYNAKRPNQPLELQELDAETDVTTLLERVRAGELYGYILIPPNVIAAPAGCTLARKDNQLRIGVQLEEMIREAVTAARFHDAGIDREQVAALRAQEVPVQWLDAATGTPISADQGARIMTPYAFMFLLFMGTFVVAQGLLTTVIEEKSSRVIEVLLSAVSPTQLMAGKILGTAFVGLALVAVWGSVGFAGARAAGVADLVSGYRIVVALLYFVPGYLLMAALMAGIGSACNDLKEAQSMIFPLSLLTMIAMIFGFYFLEHPNSPWSVLLSHIPLITPFVMVLRVCADPDTPVWQIVTTLGVLWLSVLLAIRAAGKIFRVGVLMYGKPPSPRELLRWLRYA
jgi:ABC-2 type transport system permease protein